MRTREKFRWFRLDGAVRLAVTVILCGLPGVILLAARPAQGQTNEPQHGKTLPLKPSIPGVQTNQRLILKDGTFQIVRKFEIVGDRVRYVSVERGGEWEELPSELVDWEATRKWAEKQQESDDSPAMKEAAALDLEEATARQAQLQRMPEVAKGLNLPDADGVFALDYYHGTPQIVELPATDGELQMVKLKGQQRVVPLGGKRSLYELSGSASRIALHVAEPVFYFSLDSGEDVPQVVGHALTVDTHGGGDARNHKQGAESADVHFALVRADPRRAVRLVSQIRVSSAGEVVPDDTVIAVRAEVLPGKHWIKVTPTEPLTIGEYALVEILSPTEVNASVWDFSLNPRAGLNEGAVGPIESH